MIREDTTESILMIIAWLLCTIWVLLDSEVFSIKSLVARSDIAEIPSECAKGRIVSCDALEIPS